MNAEDMWCSVNSDMGSISVSVHRNIPEHNAALSAQDPTWTYSCFIPGCIVFVLCKAARSPKGNLTWISFFVFTLFS